MNQEYVLSDWEKREYTEVSISVKGGRLNSHWLMAMEIDVYRNLECKQLDPELLLADAWILS